MEKATEEAARRGQAESARAEIEKDLDDLSAGLFDQANRMVAEGRIAEARSFAQGGRDGGGSAECGGGSWCASSSNASSAVGQGVG